MRLRPTPSPDAAVSADRSPRLPLAVVTALTLALFALFPALASAAPSTGKSGAVTRSANVTTSSFGLGSVHQVAPGAVGVSPSLQLSDLDQSNDIVLPAIPGITWTGVRARIQWPSQLRSGTLAVGTPTRTFQSITASTDITKLQSVSFAVEHALPGAQYLVGLTPNLHYLSTYAPCGTVDNLFQNAQEYTPTVYIQSISYRITGTNETVGAYLQGPIQHLIFRIPSTADAQTKQALLQLETELVANDADTSVSVAVLPASAPLPARNYFTRVVSFAGGSSGAGSISVGPDGMTISGDGAGAQRQVDLLQQSYASLLQTTEAKVVRADGNTRVFPNTLSFSQLGVNDLTASGWGDFSIGLSFTEAATGGEVQGANYSIRGTNSGLASGAGATITLLDNGTPIQGAHLYTGRPWSLNGSVPSSSIGRSIGLSLQVQYFGSVGRCAQLPPLTVAVAPTSGFTFTRGESIETGFEDLPQMLMPTVDVVLSDPDSFTQFQSAATLLAGAQRLTPVTLGVTYSGSSKLPAGTEPAIVVADSGSPLSRVLTPAALTTGAVQFTHANLTTEVQIGAKEAFLTAGRRNNGGSVLALLYPSSQPGLAQSLLGALGGSEQRWYGLTGDTAVLGTDGQVATAQVGLTQAITVAQVAKSWLSYRWVWALLGAAFIGLVLILMRFGARLRASTSGGPDRRSADRREDRRRDEPPRSD